MKKYKYYLFDFDGTLFDTRDALTMVFKESFKAVGIEIKDEQVPWLSRVPLPESYKQLGAPNDKESWERFIDVIEETLNGPISINATKAFDDTLTFFDYVKRNNINVGIVTSNNSNHVRDILNHFNIPFDLVKVIIGNVEAPIPKPDPLPLRVALKELNVENNPQEVVYIGDSTNDCLSAINAGIDYYFLDREEQGHYKERSIESLMELFND